MIKSNSMLVAALLTALLILLSGCNDDKKIEETQRHKHDQETAKARFEQWAYVAKQKNISSTETVRLLIIPDPEGLEFMDTKCLIYTHQEFKQSTMICPDADKDAIAETPDY